MSLAISAARRLSSANTRSPCNPDGFASAMDVASVPKVPHAGEHHRHAEFVSSGNHILITHRTAWLRDSSRSRFTGLLHSVGEWKECIGRHYASRERKAVSSRF